MMTSRLGIGKFVATFLAVVIITIAGVSSYYLSSSTAFQINETTNQPTSSTCASAIQVSDYVFTSPSPNKQVLLLQPGSTVHVCVTYQTNWTSTSNYASYQNRYFSNGNLNIPFQIYNDITVKNGTTTTQVISGAQNGTSTSYTVTNQPQWAFSSKPFFASFKATMQPSSISPTVGLTSFTVVYTITPLSNSTGYYSDFGPAPGLLVSVGHSSSQLRASDFPYAGVGKPGGSPPPYHAEAVSVVGATVTSLTIPAGWPFGGPGA